MWEHQKVGFQTECSELQAGGSGYHICMIRVTKQNPRFWNLGFWVKNAGRKRRIEKGEKEWEEKDKEWELGVGKEKEKKE